MGIFDYPLHKPARIQALSAGLMTSRADARTEWSPPTPFERPSAGCQETPHLGESRMFAPVHSRSGGGLSTYRPSSRRFREQRQRRAEVKANNGSSLAVVNAGKSANVKSLENIGKGGAEAQI